jgi:hypothetical protein
MAQVREIMGPLPGLEKLVIHDARPRRYGLRNGPGRTRDQGDPRGFSSEQIEAARTAQARQPGPGAEAPYYPPQYSGADADPDRPISALSTEEIAERNRRDWQQARREPLMDPGLARRSAMAAGADRQRLYDRHWLKDAAGGRLMRHVVDLDPVEGGEGSFEGMSEAGERHELRRQGEGFSLWREESPGTLQSNDTRRRPSDCRCSDRQKEVDRLAMLQRDLDGYWRGRLV